MPVALTDGDKSKARLHLGYSYAVKLAYPGEYAFLTDAMNQIEDTITRDRISKQIAICEQALEETAANAGLLNTEQIESDGQITTTLQQRPSYAARQRVYAVATSLLARLLGVRKFD